MQRAFFTTNQHAAQLTGVHLALNTRHIVQNGLVVAQLGRGHFLLERPHIAANGAIRSWQLTNLRLQLAGKLDGAELGKLLEQMHQVIPVIVEALRA